MLEVLQCSVHGIDIFVIGDVVAEIELRRGIAGRNPNCIYADFVKIVEFGGDAIQVAYAVAVAVGEAARIDFIEHCVLPPAVGLRIRSRILGPGKRKGETRRYYKQEYGPKHSGHCYRSPHCLVAWNPFPLTSRSERPYH